MSFKRFFVLWLSTMLCFFLIVKYVPTISEKMILIWIVNTYPVWLLRKITPDFKRMPMKVHILLAFLWPITYLFTSTLGLITLVLMAVELAFCKLTKIKFTDKLSRNLYNLSFVAKINDILR